MATEISYFGDRINKWPSNLKKFKSQGDERKVVSKSTNSEPADAEGVPSSSKEGIIRGLNDDLAREYKAIIQYVVFSST